MNPQLVFADHNYGELISNMMQFYIYDFSIYVDRDLDEHGLYKPYPNLAEYWKGDNDKCAYVIKEDEKCIGFILVKKLLHEISTHTIAEFFIMKRYRRKGIGKNVALQIFELYKGQWEVFQMENNLPAQKFWVDVIDEFTNGHFSERFENGRRIQNFSS